MVMKRKKLHEVQKKRKSSKAYGSVEFDQQKMDLYASSMTSMMIGTCLASLGESGKKIKKKNRVIIHQPLCHVVCFQGSETLVFFYII